MKKPIKFCKNPDCQDEILDYKSSKREYCNDYCRNHHGHKRRSEENLEFNNFKKGMLENFKLLKLHRDKNILIENLNKYEKLGFNTNYLPDSKFAKISGVITKYYQIKDIAFGLDPEDQTKIIIFKKTEKKEKK